LLAHQSGSGRGFGKDTPVTSGGNRALRAIGGDDGPHAFGGGNILLTDVGSNALVTGGGLVATSDGTLAGGGICETGGDAAAREGVDDKSILFKVVGERDDVLHTEDSNGELSAGNNDILAVGEGGDALPTDDNSGALRVDSGSGGDATVPVIGTISVNSILGVGE
jgi:hypothetical protein